MNERIQKFAREAAGGMLSYDAEGEWRLSEREVGKFAESIARECMWKIMNRKEEAIDNDWDVDEAMSAAIADISEHFGVDDAKTD